MKLNVRGKINKHTYGHIKSMFRWKSIAQLKSVLIAHVGVKNPSKPKSRDDLNKMEKKNIYSKAAQLVSIFVLKCWNITDKNDLV